MKTGRQNVQIQGKTGPRRVKLGWGSGGRAQEGEGKKIKQKTFERDMEIYFNITNIHSHRQTQT